MNFGASDPLHDYQIADFGGVDFSTLENKVNFTRSPDAANMLMNHNGYLEKRTGYKRLFQGEDKINGIFDYKPAKADKTFYFMHAGTKLYAISFGENGAIVTDKLLLEDLKDCKSRHFVYNDRLYILGCGYIQIYWHDNIIEYGHVNKAGTVTDKALEIAFVDRGSTDVQYVNIASSTKIERILLDKTYNTRVAKTGDVIASAIAIPTQSKSFRIAKVELRSTTGVWVNWNLRYIQFDLANGCFDLLGDPGYGASSGIPGNAVVESAFSFDTVRVEFYDDTSLTAPLVIVNRTALPVRNDLTKWYYGAYSNADLTHESYVDKLPLDGDALDAANFASARRRVSFVVPEGGSRGYAFYLLPQNEKSIIHKISIDGVPVTEYWYTYSTYKVIKSGIRYEGYFYTNTNWPIVDVDPGGRYVVLYFRGQYWVQGSSTDSFADVNTNLKPGATVEIEFTPIRDDDSDDEQISDCSIYGIYGGNNDTRVFLSGNPKFPNRDYASGLYDATYFPNTMYTDVGSSASANVGYHKLYSNQIIIKDDATEDASQFLRSLNMDAAGNVTYTLIQGQSTYGGCCASSFKNVAGLPFYVGKDGVYSIAGTTVQNQNNTTLRSLQINKRFLQEDLKNAVCCRFEDNYIVATGTHMWICDTNHGLEWFYFNGLPEITCIFPHNDRLYFGTSDGRVCVFSKREDKDAYYDNLSLDGSTDGAVPVQCHWCTPTSAFDNWNMYKTVANVYLSIIPYNDTSVTVYYNSSDDAAEEITTEKVGLFDFNEMNFDNFSFDGIRQPKPFATGVKCKNVYVFGVKLENAAAQPFGIVSVGYKYKYSKYIK